MVPPQVDIMIENFPAKMSCCLTIVCAGPQPGCAKRTDQADDVARGNKGTHIILFIRIHEARACHK